MSDEIALLHHIIDRQRDTLVASLQGVLRIPSKKDEPAPNAPYGLPVRQALDYTMDLCRELGFRVQDFEGHACHAEFGEGEEMIAALGHLDVVPEGDRWQHPPYGAEIDNGFIYARGASDDKGPTYAALFAAKAIMDSGLPLRRRIRVIFGCDEESGFGCVHHYWDVAKEERPLYAFTPDAHFPLIYAEKGIANLTLEQTVGSGASAGSLRVAEARGGRRTNMVPDFAEARIEGKPGDLYSAARALNQHWDKNITYDCEEKGIWVRVSGKSGHGSTPLVGDNAVRRLARCLMDLELPDDHGWLDWIDRSADITGAGLGIQGRDDVAGPLTNNLGILEMEGGRVRLVYNIRYPVTWKIDELLAKLQPVIGPAGWALAAHSDSPPLHVALDEEPVKTLLEVYRAETGDLVSQPETIGGGTYARATPRAVAYGASFPDRVDGPAHEPDERISIDNLVKAAKIYAHALYRLAS